MRSQPLSSSTSTNRPPSPDYAVPCRLAPAIAASLVLGRRRVFSVDARRMVRSFRPHPRIEDTGHIPPAGPFVLVTNHYYKPGYHAWWGVAAIAATIAERRVDSPEMVWMLANRWTYSNAFQSRVVTPLTHWVFARLARTYEFISTPPMPRQEKYTEEGAQSVRRILALYDAPVGREAPAIGVVPEGRDSEDGGLIEPPLGAGRLLLHLARRGLSLLPVGVAEIDGFLTLRFGPVFVLNPWPGLDKDERDRRASAQVMLAIGRLLPADLWGVYRVQLEQAQHSSE
jgi:hypothetical protein